MSHTSLKRWQARIGMTVGQVTTRTMSLWLHNMTQWPSWEEKNTVKIDPGSEDLGSSLIDFQSVCVSVDWTTILVQKNISTTIRWFNQKFGTDIHGAKKIYPNDLGDLLTFHLAPPVFTYPVKHLYSIDWYNILYCYSWFPEDES